MPYPGTENDFETENRLRRHVAESARLPAPLTVESAVAAVMCVLIERLTAGEAHELVEGIPEPLRPMFRTCVMHRGGQPVLTVDRAEFLARVADHLDVTPAHAEVVTSAVFAAVRAEMPPELAANVAAQLPRGLKELWLGPPIAAPDLDVTFPSDRQRRDVEVEIERRAHLEPPLTGASAFRAVMCALTRRLSGGEAKDVLLGLPSELRELVESCVIHRPELPERFDRAALIRDVGEHLAVGPEDAERIARVVIRAAQRVLPQQTIAAVASQLPSDTRDLWR